MTTKPRTFGPEFKRVEKRVKQLKLEKKIFKKATTPLLKKSATHN